WRSSTIPPHNSATPSRTTTLIMDASAHFSFFISAKSFWRMVASSFAVFGSVRARLTIACIRLERVTIPTTLFPCTTGRRLMRRCSINSTIFSCGVSSLTVCTSVVITSATLLPCEWVYSAAILPGPIKKLQPKGAFPVGANLPATQKIAFGEDTDQFSGLVDDREAADMMLKHVPRRLKHCRVRIGRNDTRRHDVAGFHGSLQFFESVSLQHRSTGI